LALGYAVVSDNCFTLFLAAWVIAELIWGLACAVACPRNEAAIRYAWLSHTLMNVFFQPGLNMSGFL